MFLLWILVIVLAFLLFWNILLPWLLARFLSVYLGGSVRIGGIQCGRIITQFSLTTKKFELSIASVRLTSSIFSSEANNLLTVILSGVDLMLTPVEESTPVLNNGQKKTSTSKGKLMKKLMLVAPFFGLQVLNLKVTITKLASLPSCHLILQLDELRVDSAVIYRIKLSITAILYQGRLYVEDSLNKTILLDTHFSLQSSCQAKVQNGLLTSVEESKLDIDGFNLHLSSGFFHHLVLDKTKKESTGSSGLGDYTVFIPTQAEIKAEDLSMSLDHTDKVSSLNSNLQLMYISVKCTEPPRPGSIPDSHLSAQLSALRITTGILVEKVFELCKFQVLVQKDGHLLNSDTQVHECRAKYSAQLAPWISPLSWLVQKIEKNKDKSGESEEKSNILSGFIHEHQLDAWNSYLSICDNVDWDLSVHHLQGGYNRGVSQISLQRVECNSNSCTVLKIGQTDFRLQKPKEKKQIDLIITDSTFHYLPSIYDMTAKLHESLHPLLVQIPIQSTSSPGNTSSHHNTPTNHAKDEIDTANNGGQVSLAVVISQSKLCFNPEGRGDLCLEVRELEAAGDRHSGEFTLTGVKFSLDSGNGETLTCVNFTQLVCNKKINEMKIIVDQKMKFAWKPNVLLSVEHAIRELKKFESLVQMKTNKVENSNGSHEKKVRPVVSVIVKESLTFQIITGEYTTKLKLNSLKARYNGGDTSSNTNQSWSVESPKLQVKMAEKRVLIIEELYVALIDPQPRVTLERRRMQGMTVPTNSCILFSAHQVSFTEPYEFKFHNVFFDEFLGTWKWIKSKYLTKKNKDGKLSKDIWIKIEHFKMELSDDPFEVKLRDNYELKKDEYNESAKRQRVLEEKIAGFRKQNLVFPSEKYEQLVQNLKQRNAELYIQRCRKLTEKYPARTRLLEWEMDKLELMALADDSMHGKANVINHLQEFDCYSPWPTDNQLEFNTLWCRWVKVEAQSFVVSLRDFPQKLLNIRSLALWGKLAGAEFSPFNFFKRSVRSHRVNIGYPYEDEFIERNMCPLKFYYDLACDVESLSMAYGLCWEPTLTQCSLALNYLTGQSRDPSTPLPWWDKVRLLFHGRLLLAAQTHQLLLHASLDPYNTTEEMDVSWTDMTMTWSEAEVKVEGTLDIYVRTASKYDDGHLLHLPNLNLCVKMDWICLNNPKDHHSVMPCAPDKLPEYSSNQEHDSFRAFRSSKLDLSVHFETKGRGGNRTDRPKLDMFSSTIRWFENLKFIFSGATRPIRRGNKFHNHRPKKPHFSRHFNKVDISVSLHQFQVNYWTSFSKQRGILLNVGRGIHLAAHHQLNIIPYTDGLKRRPRADWTISYISCDLTASDIWIQSSMTLEPEPDQEINSNPPSPSNEAPPTPTTSRAADNRDGTARQNSKYETQTSTSTTRINRSESLRNMVKSFFFCVEKVLYTRNSFEEHEPGKPTHKLAVHGARGAWTQSNRDMFFALYESWRRAQILRRNVSSDALKLFHTEKHPSKSQEKTPFTSPTPASSSGSPFAWGTAPPPTTSNTTATSKVTGSILDRLLLETEHGSTPTAYTEDMDVEEDVKHTLEAMAACTKDDIIHWNWSIELINSQLLMKGIETSGYVIMSAARASISQNMHRPVFKERALLSKSTWSGGLEGMQYYATVSKEGADMDNIMWLQPNHISDGDERRDPGPAGLVGSGKAVGGVVSDFVGVTDSPSNFGEIQLQRVVSKCRAEFFYVSYGDTPLDDVEVSLGNVGKSTGSPVADDDWDETETAVNAFTLVHHDLNMCTNSAQYVMVLDIINNLLLYNEPTQKARTDRYLRMRYQFMLEIDALEDHRKRIISLQNQLRQLVCEQRRTEKTIYLKSCDLNTKQEERDRLELEAQDIKDKMLVMNEDLDMMIRCYKETQMSSSQRQSALRGASEGSKLRRRGEICFSKAAWRLTEIDGQLGIADINISNFIFTRSSKSDDSVENLLEMGYVNMRNLLPNQLYENVLTPTELKRDMPVDRQRTVRVYSRERARVGGISVKDHFEINVAPLTICITALFYKKMMTFAFPEKDAETFDDDFEADKKSKKKNKKSKNASFYVECPSVEKDDVEKMKERAERNKLFIYIKIPEVPIKVSYKGEKEKNQILDVADFQLQVPTIEYHNVTWTWLDLLLAVKSKTKDSLVTQAIKQKFLRNKHSGKEEQAPGDEEKARMLLGSSSVLGSAKPGRRFLPRL